MLKISADIRQRLLLKSDWLHAPKLDAPDDAPNNVLEQGLGSEQRKRLQVHLKSYKGRLRAFG